MRVSVELEDPGGVEPLDARIKSPLPDLSGLTLRVQLVLPHGYDPWSSGYRPGALPLSYERKVVLRRGVEPRVSCMSGRRLAAKLTELLRPSMVPAPGLEPGSAGVWDRSLCRLAKRASG